LAAAVPLGGFSLVVDIGDNNKEVLIELAAGAPSQDISVLDFSRSRFRHQSC
jgi:hypothetical protein